METNLLSAKKDGQSRLLRVLVDAGALLVLVVMLGMILYILFKGIPNLSPDLFSWNYTSDNVSLMPALINTLSMMLLSLLFSLPAGIGAAIFLVEYTKKGSRFVRLISVAAETLAGIPSIVFGLFGSLCFVKFFHLGLSILSGSLTLALMVLPLIMRTTFQALEEVPDLYREGSYGLGAGRVRTIFRIVLPSAAPGIFAGVVLAVGKIAGESAALLFTAGSAAQIASSLSTSGRTLAVHMYVLSCEGLHTPQTYATAVVLMIMLVVLNAISDWIRKKIGAGNNGK